MAGSEYTSSTTAQTAPEKELPNAQLTIEHPIEYWSEHSDNVDYGQISRDRRSYHSSPGTSSHQYPPAGSPYNFQNLTNYTGRQTYQPGFSPIPGVPSQSQAGAQYWDNHQMYKQSSYLSLNQPPTSGDTPQNQNLAQYGGSPQTYHQSSHHPNQQYAQDANQWTSVTPSVAEDEQYYGETNNSFPEYNNRAGNSNTFKRR